MSRYNERFMIVARRVLIGGRVQGVGFRMFAAARAAAEGIHGYARNLPDGRVEVLMEGDNDAVDRMELALRRGAPRTRTWNRSTSRTHNRHTAQPDSRHDDGLKLRVSCQFPVSSCQCRDVLLGTGNWELETGNLWKL
jgi:acylphosphatase